MRDAAGCGPVLDRLLRRPALSRRRPAPMERPMRLFVRAAAAALAAVFLLPGADAAYADGPAAVGAGQPDFNAAGQHTVVILPVYWTAPDAQTTTSLRAHARQLGDYWSEQTNGALTVPDANITVH